MLAPLDRDAGGGRPDELSGPVTGPLRAAGTGGFILGVAWASPLDGGAGRYDAPPRGDL
jgi:hypothetical protein